MEITLPPDAPRYDWEQEVRTRGESRWDQSRVELRGNQGGARVGVKPGGSEAWWNLFGIRAGWNLGQNQCRVEPSGPTTLESACGPSKGAVEPRDKGCEVRCGGMTEPQSG